MKTAFFLLAYITLGVMSVFSQDRDETFTRPPVRGAFYKILSKDEITGRKDITAGEIVSASGILGHVHIGLPYIASATHEPWITIGTRILSASDEIDPIPSLNWYTAKLIFGSTTWVMDQGNITDSSGPVTIIYATRIVSVTNETNILNATTVNVDIIDARIFNVDVTYATTTNTTVLYASGVVTEPYEQNFIGDGSSDDVEMDYAAHTEGFVLEAVTAPHISHVYEWVLGTAYSQTLDASGYVISVVLSPGYRWYPATTFRFRYVRADL